MQAIRMVVVTTLASGFQAQVIVARLGAAGILARTDGADTGPYPAGPTSVLVEEDQLAAATALLGFDVEARRPRPRTISPVPIVAIVVLAVIAMSIAASVFRLH